MDERTERILSGSSVKDLRKFIETTNKAAVIQGKKGNTLVAMNLAGEADLVGEYLEKYPRGRCNRSKKPAEKNPSKKSIPNSKLFEELVLSGKIVRASAIKTVGKNCAGRGNG